MKNIHPLKNGILLIVMNTRLYLKTYSILKGIVILVNKTKVLYDDFFRTTEQYNSILDRMRKVFLPSQLNYP